MAGVMILVAGLYASQAFGADRVQTAEVIDLGNASVRFQVRVLGLAQIVGRFERLSGELVSGAERESGSVRMCIDVNSVNTNDELRDALLRSSTFFDTERYPQITFSRSRLIYGKDGPEQIVGDLSLHGTTRPVVFDVEPVVPAEAYDASHYRAIATIKRSDFGLDALRPIVSDEVEIIVAMQANTISGSQLTRHNDCPA